MPFCFLGCKPGGRPPDSLPGSGSAPLLLPGDTLALHYALAPEGGVPPGGWLLVLDRAAATAATARAGQRSGERTAALPAAFALLQNQSNPCGARITIRFELPVGAMVRL